MIKIERFGNHNKAVTKAKFEFEKQENTTRKCVFTARFATTADNFTPSVGQVSRKDVKIHQILSCNVDFSENITDVSQIYCKYSFVKYHIP